VSLYDAEFLEKLEYLHLVSRKLFAGTTKGERRSIKKGTSVEFADYKTYAPGDDFRYIDWNIFRRLDKLLVKLYEEEQELYLYILVDASRSMQFGTPLKFDFARQVAAALAYVGLASGDRVSIAFFDERVRAQLAPVRGKAQIFNVFSFLERAETGGVTDLTASFSEFCHQISRKGVVLVLSDLLDDSGFDRALRQLAYAKFEVYVIQLVDALDADPQLQGSLSLTDSETGQVCEVQLTPAALASYRASFASYCEEIQAFCRTHGMSYLLAPTATDFDSLILQVFRQGGIVR